MAKIKKHLGKDLDPANRNGGRDLSGARVEGADQLSLEELVRSLQEEVDRTRDGKDEYEKSHGLLASLPWWLMRPALWLTDLLSNELAFHLPSRRSSSSLIRLGKSRSARPADRSSLLVGLGVDG